MTTLADVVAEGERLLDLADDAGVELRLLGGVAVRMRAPSVPAALDREYKDIDFAIRKRSAGPLDRLIREAGYEPHVTFNAMNARERALYLDEAHGRQVDVFIESFRMCHEIDLGDRIAAEPRTLPGNLGACRSHIGEYALPDGGAEAVSARIDALLEAIEAEPKSRGWRRRAKVGERKP